MHKNYYRNSLGRLFLAAITYLTINMNVSAQKTDSHAVTWIKYQNQLWFTDKLYWTNEFDNRRFIAPDAESQYIMHTHLHYKRNRWDYAVGLSMSWAYSVFAKSPIQHPTTEVRPFVETAYEQPFKGWSLQHKIRIDNRFIEEDKYDAFAGNNYYVMRIRYRLQARIPVLKDENNKAKCILKFADEIMLNNKMNTFDQNRIYAIAEIPFSSKWGIEAGYIYIYQQRLGKDEFLNRHVLRFSLLHKIKLY